MLPELIPNLPGINTVLTVRRTVLALWFDLPLDRVCTVATLCPALWSSLVLTTQVTIGVNRDTSLADQIIAKLTPYLIRPNLRNSRLLLTF